MGSSFSIYNDTDHDIYVINQIQMDYAQPFILIGDGVLGALKYKNKNGIEIGGLDGLVEGILSEEDVPTAINEFKKVADKKLAPGQIYSYNGSLSLTRSVYLMNEKGVTKSRGCWTGPTDKSDIRYNVSEDWNW